MAVHEKTSIRRTNEKLHSSFSSGTVWKLLRIKYERILKSVFFTLYFFKDKENTIDSITK